MRSNFHKTNFNKLLLCLLSRLETHLQNMAFIHLVLAIVLCSLQIWHSDAGAVKEFQDWDEFRTDFFSRDYSMVDFFASWCPHCNTFAPKFEKAADIISHGDLNDRVQLAKIQCDSEKGQPICASNKIEGYPTIIVYQKGKKFDHYQGSRSPEAIVKYVQEIVKNGKPQFVGKKVKDQQICLAKDFRKYVIHKS